MSVCTKQNAHGPELEHAAKVRNSRLSRQKGNENFMFSLQYSALLFVF